MARAASRPTNPVLWRIHATMNASTNRPMTVPDTMAEATSALRARSGGTPQAAEWLTRIARTTPMPAHTVPNRPRRIAIHQPRWLALSLRVSASAPCRPSESEMAAGRVLLEVGHRAEDAHQQQDERDQPQEQAERDRAGQQAAEALAVALVEVEAERHERGALAGVLGPQARVLGLALRALGRGRQASLADGLALLGLRVHVITGATLTAATPACATGSRTPDSARHGATNREQRHAHCGIRASRRADPPAGGAVMGIFLFILAVLWLAIIITSLLHLWHREELTTTAKVVWTAVMVVLPFLGTVVYLIVGVFLRDSIHPME